MQYFLFAVLEPLRCCGVVWRAGECRGANTRRLGLIFGTSKMITGRKLNSEDAGQMQCIHQFDLRRWGYCVVVELVVW
jgi:hypothetical protein